VKTAGVGQREMLLGSMGKSWLVGTEARESQSEVACYSKPYGLNYKILSSMPARSWIRAFRGALARRLGVDKLVEAGRRQKVSGQARGLFEEGSTKVSYQSENYGNDLGKRVGSKSRA